VYNPKRNDHDLIPWIITAATLNLLDFGKNNMASCMSTTGIYDTDVVYDDVQALFGTDVADGVLALTIDETIGAGLGKFERRWMQLEDYLSRIKQQPREIWMVKLADRITNLQPPPSNWDDEKIARYKQGAELIHKELASASEYLGERLEGKIDRYAGG
jgi:(p)ppGpp synthase/HD superfamily hydrolase